MAVLRSRKTPALVVFATGASFYQIAEALPTVKCFGAHWGSRSAVNLEAAHDRQLSYLLQDCIRRRLRICFCVPMSLAWSLLVGCASREDRVGRLKEILGLPASVIPVGRIAIGYPAESKAARHKINSDCVHLNEW